jgi:hypothetical protein
MLYRPRPRGRPEGETFVTFALVGHILRGRGFRMQENGEGPEGKEIWTLNRELVVIRPKAPFVEWVQSVDPTGEPPPAERILSTSTSFLIPEFTYPEESWEWIEENCSVMFETELWDWVGDEDRWPPDRGWPVFREWFEIEHIDTIWDLVAEPLSSDVPEG